MNVAIRASSLAELFDCPARWEAKHVRGLRLPASGAARLGTAVHAGAAVFDQARLDGAPLTAEAAAGAVVDAIWHPDEDVAWNDVTPREAEAIAVPLHTLYCETIAPAQTYLAVEARAEHLTLADLGLTLTGTVDRVRAVPDGPDLALGIADLKTGKTAVTADGTVKTAGHAAQMGVYELLAEAALGHPVTAPAQIIGLTTAKTPKGRRAGTAEIADARAALFDDGDSPGLLRHAARLIHSGDFYGNPRSQTCGANYCPAYPNCRWRK